MDRSSLLYVEKLTYKARRPIQVQIDHLDLRLGHCLAFTGANGTGKSTTLHILAGLIRPCQGRVLLQGVDIHRDPVGAKQYLGILPEKLPLYPELQVTEYLSFVASLHQTRASRNLPQARQAAQGSHIMQAMLRLHGDQTPKSLRQEWVDRALEDLHLQSYRHTLIRQLSRGTQQRVGLAQAIIHRPKLLLLDEPTNGLDPREIAHFNKYLEEYKKEGAIILSTHYLHEIEGLYDAVIDFNQPMQIPRVAADQPRQDEKRAHSAHARHDEIGVNRANV